jgi:hypothetical protein
VKYFCCDGEVGIGKALFENDVEEDGRQQWGPTVSLGTAVSNGSVIPDPNDR